MKLNLQKDKMNGVVDIRDFRTQFIDMVTETFAEKKTQHASISL